MMREKIIQYLISKNGSVSLKAFEKHFRYESYHLPDVYREAITELKDSGKVLYEGKNICLKSDNKQRELF